MSKRDGRTPWMTEMSREAFPDPASARSAGLMFAAFRSAAAGGEADVPRVGAVARAAGSPSAASADFPAVIDLATLDGTSGFVLPGLDRDDYSGLSVSSAGDVNGDGIDDLIIGAPLADPGGIREAGETYIVFGSTEGFDASFDFSALDGTNGFRIDGIRPDDFSGYSVSAAGDVNGDGFNDVIIGAGGPFFDNRPGESYVVFGKPGGHGGELDLATLDGSDGFRIVGPYARDSSGYSVSSAGDVNGDGFDDVIIGAPRGDPSGGDSYTGQSYVVFGTAGGHGGSFDLATLDGSNGFRIDGAAAFDESGRSVSSAGDVNGDGFDDLIIGAINADSGGQNRAGESYVVFGKAAGFDPSIDLAALDGTNGFRLPGVDNGDRSGVSVSDAGDVNGDGIDDIIIGAIFAEDGGGYGEAGVAYVVFGKTGDFEASFDLTSLDGNNGFRIDGVEANFRTGYSVSSAGDVNGDGFDDVIIGATFADPDGDRSAGASYVVFGHAGRFDPRFELTTLDGSDGFRLDGVDADDASGSSVSSAGDINGDGFDDIVIGAPGTPFSGGFAGENYVVFGQAPTEAVTRTGSAADQTIRGGDFDDTLLGKSGDDRLAGGDGADVLNGGTGRDRADYDTADAGVRASLAAPGNNTGEAAGDTYISIENLQGSDFNDKLAGDSLANRIEGRAGSDLLDGRGGEDRLTGEEGHDTLKGGKGADRFEFASLLSQDSDTIRDFAGGTDTIALDGQVFGLADGPLGAGRFVVGEAAGDTNDRLIYDDATGKLFFDADGTGAQAQILIATLTGAPPLMASDIIVI